MHFNVMNQKWFSKPKNIYTLNRYTMKHGLQKKIPSDMIKLSLRSSICFIIYRFSLLPFSKLKNLWVWNNGSYCILFKINYGSFSPWYVTHGLIWIYFMSMVCKIFMKFINTNLLNFGYFNGKLMRTNHEL